MSKAVAEYVASGPEPYPDQIYGDGYRCSAYLKDGTYLPCVLLRKSAPTTKLALDRFDQEKRGKGIFRSSSDAYEKIVRHFLTTGNRIDAHDIAKVEASRYAIPLDILKNVTGETAMSWTGFVLQMRDGKLLALGTTFLTEFLDIPDGLSFADTLAVHNHSYVSASGELRPLNRGLAAQPTDYDPARINRERLYFVCYHDAQVGFEMSASG